MLCIPIFLLGCGQKGPLYLPESAKNATSNK
ncbi:lipoprotein [Legionella sp. 9fVS26]|uniref:Lipoprotein n=1 Tax=Legionella resiliens TaxID=2905958 RepID=A0ABS8XAV7_9GAMM|nr:MULTISPECIES: lipoprotein [unclassified Legionella]MCE0724866.1 lipoprotein [Legionella sp. 9fVS26]MCE3534020.1 lipoprotein [Legionella sp. 8cVS16]